MLTKSSSVMSVRAVAGALTMLFATIVGAPTAGHALPRHAAGGGIEIELLEAPVARKDDPRAQAYIVDHLAPGSEIDRAVRITNTTSRAQRIDVYPGPAVIRDGEFVGLEAGERNDLTTWTRTSTRALRLGAGESTELDVTISVPDDAPESETYGVVWASVASSGDQSVQVINRVGIRVYLSVGPGGEPASDFEIDSLAPGRTSEGQPYVEATVTNTGGRAIDLRGSLRLADGPGGLKAGPFDVATGTLAPGDTEALPVELDKSTPAGPWEARLVMRSGLLEKRASAEITFPDLGLGSTVEAEEDAPWWQSWQFLVGLALLLLLLALLRLLLRRRRRTDHHDAVTPEPEVVATP